MTETKTDSIDITLIHINADIYPRLRLDEELVESYRLNMEAGVKFDPLIVQKDTCTLIDGRHRYEALKKLGKEKVEAEVLDIPDNELRTEAVRRNIKHGKRLTIRELRRMIIVLRFEDGKSLKEISEIVGRSEGRISQICEEFRLMPRYFNDLNPKVPKIDLRVKADRKKKEQVLEDLKAGLPGKEIAEKYNVSQPTVSRIKKEHEVWTSSPVYINLDTIRAREMFRVAFMNKLFKKTRLEFKKKGVLIRNSDGEKSPFVVAVFPDDFFNEYKVNKPIEGYAESDILTQLKDVDHWEIELVLLDSKTWKIRYEGHEKTHVYDELDWREFPIPNLKLDADGIPTTVHVKAKILSQAFPRKQKGELFLRMENRELTCSFKCHNDWDCNQKLEIEFLEKETDARACVNLETLDEVLKIFNGPVWIGMWSDHGKLAIGQGFRERKICFII